MAQLIRIGNSRGVRIPAPLIKQARLDAGELSLKAVEDGLLIQVRPTRKKPREGWDEAFDKALSGQTHTLSQEEHEWLDADLASDQ